MKGLIKEHTIKLSEFCFYLFFVSLLFAKGIGLYDGQTGFKIFLIVALIGWAGKMLLTSYCAGEMLFYAALIVLGGAIYLTAREKGALLVILLLCGLKNMDLKKVFQVGLVTWIVSFGTLFILTSFHLIDSAFKVHDRLGMGRIIRWSLGYAHPNVLHISYLVLVSFLIYLLKERIRFFHLLILELGNLYVFMYSLSTTGFLVTTICLLLVCYWKIRKRFCKVEQVLLQFCLPVCLFLSFGAPILLKGRAFDIVNKLLNTRLSLSKWFLENQPVKLLGVNTTSIVTAVRTMDNSYVFALITYGIIFFLWIICVYFRGIYRKTKEQDGIALCVILSCLIAGLTEPFLFNTSFKNLSLLLVGAELFPAKQIGDQQICLLKFDRSINIPLPDISQVCNRKKVNAGGWRTGVVVISVAGALIAGAIAFYCTTIPERYLLPRKNFEYTDDLPESYYLTSPTDVLQEGDKILGYESEQTEMVIFSGNIAQVERFRNTVAAGVTFGLLIYGAGSIALLRKKGYQGRTGKDGE